MFVLVGLHYELQMYADGSIFSYAVAVQDAWAFHWHNISGRLFVYLFAHVPAEGYVALSRNAHGGIVLYGFLFFAAPLLGLAGTWMADRSRGRIIFTYACLSTACLCPLVFGFPTEMWVAHALFWPALAIAHYARSGIGGAIATFAALLALVFTHEGALILAIAIPATLLLRGARSPEFSRGIAALVAALSIWALVKLTIPPDDYFARIIPNAALNFISIANFSNDFFVLLLVTLAGYGALVLALRPLTPTRAPLYAASIVTLALLVYWLDFDHSLHTSNRYYLRTALPIAEPVLGMLAAAAALSLEEGTAAPKRLSSAGAILAFGAAARTLAGAVALLMLVHAVETAKFATAWTHYKAAVRALAMGSASDRAPLGDSRFVSADRIPPALNRLAWASTTPYLSVLLAPHFVPARLVVDRDAGYYWLSCATARASEEADRAVPAQSRRLVRAYSCLHRR
jgi:hypothetical protein